MTIPRYDEFYPGILEFLSDGSVHTMKEMRESCIDYYKISEEEVNKLTQRGDRTIFADRLSWSATYLKKAGLIESPARSQFRITEIGKKAVRDGSDKVTNDYLLQFDSYREFIHPNREKHENIKIEETIERQSQDKTPEEMIQYAVEKHNRMLSDKLLEEIQKIDPYDFEKLVLNLLIKMGYGSIEYSENTKKSKDEGIDGIVSSDRFGFDSVYIQAKKWTDATVGRPEIQKFVGSLSGQGASKGLFITTAKFSKEALEYPNKINPMKIILIDGNQLTDLMIEFNVGVSPGNTFELKRIDYDFFNEE